MSFSHAWCEADAPTLRRFYAELLGWNIAVDQDMDYGLVSDGEQPPVGGIGQAGEGDRHPAGVVACFPVADLDAALSVAQRLGANIAIDPWEIPGLGRMVVVTDPEGNRIELMSC
ncbi:VOC family protein [Amycolatopsis taiwanensis]|uniref:VOC family protein n=1 Tax=Amycolatopsis taiwanensis TaxID=342230 RepID=UPI000480CEAE|nr:VOC family protein [Amycolatopsis taiwanensis]